MRSRLDKESTSAVNIRPITMLKEATLRALEKKLSVFLPALAERLFCLSSESTFPTPLRPKAFEAYALVKAQQRAFKSDFLGGVNAGFDRLIGNSDEYAASTDLDGEASELDLVDLDSFNDDLAINRIAKQAVDHHWQAVEAVTLRVAKVLKVKPKTIVLPTSPHQLTNAYRDCIKRFELPARIVLELDKLFLSEFLTDLGDFYESQNALLRAEGLLPDVENLIEQQGSQLKEPEQQDSPHPPPEPTRQNRSIAGSHGGEDNLGEAASKNTTGAEGPYLSEMGSTDSGFVKEARHSDDHAGSGKGHRSLEEHGNYLPGRKSQTGTRGALLEERRSSVLEHSTSTDTGKADLEKKAVELSEHILSLRKMGVTADRSLNSVVKQLELDQLGEDMAPITRSVELIDNLYNTIDQYLPLSEHLKTSINTVRLPLAQLSIKEPTFYRDPEHPARLFMERIGEVMRLAPENNGRIAGEIDQITEKLNESFEQDPKAFDIALHETTDLAVKILRQQQVAIDRLVAAEEGKEKRLLAHRQACLDIEKALHQQPLPETYLLLLESIALDALSIMLLRQDTDGYAAGLEQLISWAKLLTDTRLQGTLKTLQEAGDCLDHLKGALHLPEILLPEQDTVLEQLSLELQGHKPQAISRGYKAPLPDCAEPEFSQRLTRLPRLRRWTHRARELAIGTWVSDASGQGEKHHAQLIWRNKEATRFVFINEKAQKYREFTLTGLARWLATRLNPVEPVDQLSIVDKSLFIALEKKQADLLKPESRSENALLSTEDMIDITQIQIRKARRGRDITHCAMIIPKQSVDILQRAISALEDLGSSDCISGTVDENSIGILIGLDKHSAQQRLQTVFSSGELERVSVRAIDGSQSSAESLWREMLNVTEGLGAALETEKSLSESTQPEIKRSIEHTLRRFEEDTPPCPGFRKIILTNPHRPDSADFRYQVLLDGSPTIESEALSLPNNQSDALLITLDCLKIKSACQIFDMLLNANLEVPRFQINLCTAATMHHEFLDFLLSAISDSGIGTDRLLFELRDSVRLRESPISRDFSQALRSIGCLISVSNITLSRGSTAELQALHPHNLVLDRDLLDKDVREDQLSTMQQAITELHHMINENVALRGDIDMNKAIELGIDVVESVESSTSTPEQLVASQPELAK